MQTRKHSLIEALVNVAVGYGINVLAQMIVFPWFGIHISAGKSLSIGLVFTVISIARSYALRRIFTKRTEQNIKP